MAISDFLRVVVLVVMLQDFINRYLVSRTRPRTKKSSVDINFDAQHDGHKIFEIFENFQ